jgi:isocitrate lyase
MVTQNRFKTGLDIAKYTAAIMRKDMAEYDANASKYTQSLGCWWFCCPTKYDCC